MLFINYKGNIPQQRFYSFAVKGNHNSNKVRFVLARKQADIDLTNYVCNLKVENQEAHYKDLIMLDLVKESESELVFEWTMSNKSTQFRNIELQLEFLSTENASEVVWQTMIVEFELSETIKVGDERPTDKELSVLKQVEAEVKSYDNRITENTRDIEALQEEVETKDNIIIGDPEEHLNEQGLKKIIRPVDDNGNVNKSFMVDKIHHESTLVEKVANTEGKIDNEPIVDFDMFVDMFSGDLSGIFGEDYIPNEMTNVFIVNKEHEGETTYGVRFGDDDFEGYGALGLDCTPNKVIRVIVGKYFEYDEQGNKVFDEHCALYSDCFARAQQAHYREITEEKQMFELKTNDTGHFYFDSDGGELGFGDTRFILYGFETGKPAYDEYEPKELGSYFETTYAELKQLRGNGQLVKGALYRITDYVTTTTQKESKSAGHQFDIIVQALSESVLSEEAKAIWHTKDRPNELLSFHLTTDGGTYERYPQADGDYEGEHYFAFKQVDYNFFVYTKSLTNIPTGSSVYTFRDDEEWFVDISQSTPIDIESVAVNDGDQVNNIRYNDYFGSCNLNAWEIKYCLDNNTTRFAWALKGQAITNLNSACSQGRPLVRQPIFDGRNSSPDYSEYQYAWGVEEDVEDGDINNFIYSKSATLSNGETVYNNNVIELLQTAEVVEGKGVIYYMKDEWNNECPYDFKNIQFKRYMIDTCEKVPSLEGNYLGIKNGQGYTIDEEDFIWNYTFTWVNENNEVEDCSIVGQTLANDEGLYSGVFNNKIASVSAFNVIQHLEEPESFQFALNNIVIQATYGYENGTFYGVHGNTFGVNCYNNTFGNDCSSNTFGNDCSRNTFGNNFFNNAFGNDCSSNTFGNEYHNNRFGNNCSSNTSGSGFMSNTFGNECSHNTFGDYCYYNAFGNECRQNTFGNDCSRNTFGNDCGMNTFGDSSSPMDGYQHNIIDAGCSQIYLVANGTANYLKNVHIHLGVKNKTIAVDRGLDYETNIISYENTTMEV